MHPAATPQNRLLVASAFASGWGRLVPKRQAVTSPAERRLAVGLAFVPAKRWEMATEGDGCEVINRSQTGAPGPERGEEKDGLGSSPRPSPRLARRGEKARGGRRKGDIDYARQLTGWFGISWVMVWRMRIEFTGAISCNDGNWSQFLAALGKAGRTGCERGLGPISLGCRAWSSAQD